MENRQSSMPLPLRPPLQHHDPFDSPGEPHEMDQFQTGSWRSEPPQQRRQQEQGLDNNLPQSLSPFSPEDYFIRGSSGEPVHYFPIPPPNPYMSVPPRKPLSPHSLKTLSTVETRASSISSSKVDPEVENLIERRAGEVAVWGIHWWPPFGMVSLFVLGVIGAISHHAFYKSLDGQEATDQLRKIRYGTALAFFTKTTLVGSVIIGYRQRIWYTFRRRAMTLGAIDGLFAVIEDPTTFCNWEMIKNAKLAALMALATW